MEIAGSLKSSALELHELSCEWGNVGAIFLFRFYLHSRTRLLEHLSNLAKRSPKGLIVVFLNSLRFLRSHIKSALISGCFSSSCSRFGLSISLAWLDTPRFSLPSSG